MNIDKRKHAAEQAVGEAFGHIRGAISAIRQLEEVSAVTGYDIAPEGAEALEAWPEKVKAAGLNMPFQWD